MFDTEPPDIGFLTKDILKYLGAFRGQQVFYYSNPGNLGDCLIAYGNYLLFEKAGIRIRILHERSRIPDLEGETVFMSGGGNLVSYYDASRNFLARIHRTAGRIVILPHTIRAHGDLIAQLADNSDIICRDAPSFKYVSAQARGCKVMLMHDTAFAVSAAQVSARPQLLPPRPLGKLVRHVWQVRHLPKPANPAVLNAFRTDYEKTDIPIPPDNIDISEALKPGTYPRFMAGLGVRAMFAHMQGADTINTNRLHVCIAALLLNKMVNFYDNSYGKNKAIYEHSLLGNFGRLTWHG